MKTKAWRVALRIVVPVAALGAAACGDPESTDHRGYTKAPLENPGFTVEGEPTTLMDELGDPTYPVVRVYGPADTVQLEAPEEGS